MTDNRVSLILDAIKAGDTTKVVNNLKNQVNGQSNEQNDKVLDTYDYIALLHAALEQANPSYEIVNGIIEGAKEYKNTKQQNKINRNGIANGIGNHNIEKNLIYKIINSRSEDETKSTPLQVALEKRNPNKKIIKLLLDNGININYTYSGPFDRTKQNIQFDNYLHIAARANNIDAFLFIFKKSIENNIRLLEYNENHENPFHVAAKTRILPAVVKGMFEHLELTASNKIKTLENSIKKAKESNSDTKEFQKDLREVKEKLENDKGYIVEALRSKCALNEKKKTPLDCVSKTEKEDIKKAAGIEDKLICNKNFHLCLYIVGAIISIAALCLSLYFLFLTSQPFALSSMASMAFAGVTYLSLKACTEIHDLHNEDASMQDVGITQVSSGEGTGVVV